MSHVRKEAQDKDSVQEPFFIEPEKLRRIQPFKFFRYVEAFSAREQTSMWSDRVFFELQKT
jgi:hypothetical protein